MYSRHFELGIKKDTSKEKGPGRSRHEFLPTHEYLPHPIAKRLMQEAKKANIDIFGLNSASRKEYFVSEERKREILNSATSIDGGILKELHNTIKARLRGSRLRQVVHNNSPDIRTTRNELAKKAIELLQDLNKNTYDAAIATKFLVAKFLEDEKVRSKTLPAAVVKFFWYLKQKIHPLTLEQFRDSNVEQWFSSGNNEAAETPFSQQDKSHLPESHGISFKHRGNGVEDFMEVEIKREDFMEVEIKNNKSDIPLKDIEILNNWTLKLERDSKELDAEEGWLKQWGEGLINWHNEVEGNKQYRETLENRIEENRRKIVEMKEIILAEEMGWDQWNQIPETQKITLIANVEIQHFQEQEVIGKNEFTLVNLMKWNKSFERQINESISIMEKNEINEQELEKQAKIFEAKRISFKNKQVSYAQEWQAYCQFSEVYNQTGFVDYEFIKKISDQLEQEKMHQLEQEKMHQLEQKNQQRVIQIQEIMRRSQEYRPGSEKPIKVPRTEKERRAAFGKIISEAHEIIAYWKRVGESTTREDYVEIQKKDFRDIAEQYGSKPRDPQVERKVGEQINQLLNNGVEQEEIQSLLNTWGNIGAFNPDDMMPKEIVPLFKLRQQIIQGKEISNPPREYQENPTNYLTVLNDYLLNELSSLELNTSAVYQMKSTILSGLQGQVSPNDGRIIKIQQDVKKGVEPGKNMFESEQDKKEKFYQSLRKEAFVLGETLQRWKAEADSTEKGKLEALAKAYETNIRERIKSETFRRVNPTWELQQSFDNDIDRLTF